MMLSGGWTGVLEVAQTRKMLSNCCDLYVRRSCESARVAIGALISPTSLLETGEQTRCNRTSEVTHQVSSSHYIALAADIVSAFVSNNSVPAADLPALIANVHGALQNVANPAPQ